VVEYLRVFRHVGFFRSQARDGDHHAMDMPIWTAARRIARAANAFEEQRTGRSPQSVTVVLSEDTLVITLHGMLSPAEKGPR